MGQYAMTAQSAVRVLTALDQHGVHACVGGGWSVDALLQEQTRDHSDLDLWLAAPEIPESYQ
jgi:lincosamide nucleotidyltransferase A/C/D/E